MAIKYGSDYYMTSVKLGPKGQIVIPKEVRDMFGLDSGDTLVLMADKNRGIALQLATMMQPMVDKIFSGQAAEVNPTESEENMRSFAGDVEDAIQNSQDSKEEA